MTTYPPLKLTNTLHLGKYIGQGVGATIEEDPKYINWMIEMGVIEVRQEVMDKLKEKFLDEND
jgi:hypothetical protein